MIMTTESGTIQDIVPSFTNEITHVWPSTYLSYLFGQLGCL